MVTFRSYDSKTIWWRSFFVVWCESMLFLCFPWLFCQLWIVIDAHATTPTDLVTKRARKRNPCHTTSINSLFHCSYEKPSKINVLVFHLIDGSFCPLNWSFQNDALMILWILYWFIMSCTRHELLTSLWFVTSATHHAFFSVVWRVYDALSSSNVVWWQMADADDTRWLGTIITTFTDWVP